MPRHNKHKNSRPLRPVRVRGKRLDEVDTSKLALAMWLMAQRLAKEGDEADATVTKLPRRDCDEADQEVA